MAMKKTIIEMIEKCVGGKPAVASFLVGRETLDNTEISTLQFQELSARGVLYAMLAKSLQDGEITPNEEDKLRRVLDKHLTATQLSVESVILLNKRQ
ncbi:hypothetical protein [Rodentibacter pneumotropicus]|uniref:Uncharacterized protein n=1 Tax=Rodentibacter pneumotropicus TaxID=758 RepID=A0A4S2PBE9_9PAST|nr:hypothetical protein [Rodentibacter pneumotropicus]THA00498.1 hypothetical protein D3M79_04210 [Rodentibacter pneumotropicus]THA00749.1 hypothetical protein D3M74_07200 [Rodentibacter pneumotropicus]THA07006.1 hypothetical protein D3M77_07085 [Rodentibacter pneumotropicus]THA11931.1 hypothetical protein D3M76_10645 [Rodentibacter pneumotropicus]